MIRGQRKIHQLTWLALVPLMVIAIWFGSQHRGAEPPVSDAPFATEEVALP